MIKLYLLVAFCSFTTCLGQTEKKDANWQTFRQNNQRTGYSDTEVAALNPKITLKVPATNEPVVANGIAYFFEYKTRVVAFDIKRQKILWNINLDFSATSLQ